MIILLSPSRLKPQGKTFSEMIKLRIRSNLMIFQTWVWSRYLKSHRILESFAGEVPLFGNKMYSEYLSANLGVNDRLSILTQHYSYLTKIGLLDFFKTTIGHPHMMRKFNGKSGLEYQINIEAVPEGNREGELVIFLSHEGRKIYSATFTFFKDDGKVCIKVGSLQGIRSFDAAALIHRATKDFYGERPRDFLMSVLRGLGNYFGCHGLKLVSNCNRICTSGKRNAKSEVHADYDRMWIELGAAKCDNGNYFLPCSDFVKINFDDIPSKKRSEYRKKSALIIDVVQSSFQNLSLYRGPVCPEIELQEKNVQKALNAINLENNLASVNWRLATVQDFANREISGPWLPLYDFYAEYFFEVATLLMI